MTRPSRGEMRSTLTGAALAIVLAMLNALPASAQEQPAAEPSFELAPRGYVQLDWRGYPDWDVSTGTGRLNHEPFEVRRARVGLEGRWQRLSFELTIDPEDDDGRTVKDAYGQFRFARALRLRVGQFKLPGSREYNTSARNVDFLERTPLASTLAAGRDVGGMLTGEIGSRFQYWGGLFAGDGNGRDSRAGVTSAGRVAFELTNDLDVEGSFSVGRTEAIDTEDPNGLNGRAASGYRFFERVYVDGLRVRSGADVEWSPGRWRIVGAFLRIDDQRQEQGLDFEDLPRAVGTGWSAAVIREFGRGQGRPRWRQFDVALRVDELRFDDSGPETDFDSVRARATDIRARGVRTTTAGISWRPSTWTRVTTNAAWEHYTETRSGPEPGRAGFFWLGTRLQVQLP